MNFDEDYGEIVFRYKIKCAVFFRTKGDNAKYAGKRLLELLNEISIEGYFTVIDKNGVRQRELKF